MKNPLRKIVLGALLGWLLACAVFAPARWLTQPLQAASKQRILFDDVRGTVWNGSAQWALSGGPGSRDKAVLPGRLYWRTVHAAAGWSLALRSDCCLQQELLVAVQPHWGALQIQVSDSQSHWPAAWLTGLGTPWNTLQLVGDLQLNLQALSVRLPLWGGASPVLTGSARVDALGVSSRLSTLRPMGSYSVALQGGESPRLDVSTLGGDLQLSGSGQWLAGHLRFTGEARATPERLDALANLLNIIGRRDGLRSIITVG